MGLPASTPPSDRPIEGSRNEVLSNGKPEEASQSRQFYKKSSLLRSIFPFRPNREQFLTILDEEERNRLRFEINVSALTLLKDGNSLFLDGIGVAYSQSHCRQKTYLCDADFVVRSETVRQVMFEKCDDEVGISSGRFEKLVTTTELVHNLYPRLPLDLQLRWDEQAVRSLVRGFFQKIRSDLIEFGVSIELSSLGTLYALHNRQGQTLADRYAGADVVLRSRIEILELSPLGTFERPILDSSFEILASLWDRPEEVLIFKPREELHKLGIDAQYFEDHNFEVGTFTAVAGEKQTFIFATNGLRSLAASSQAGSELIVQIQAENSEQAQALAFCILALGWFLLVSSKRRALKPGVALACEECLPFSTMQAVISTRFPSLPKEHLAADTAFHFLSLVGITASEAELFSKGNKHHLLALLELKGADQVTVPHRRCLLDKTTLCSSDGNAASSVHASSRTESSSSSAA